MIWCCIGWWSSKTRKGAIDCRWELQNWEHPRSGSSTVGHRPPTWAHTELALPSWRKICAYWDVVWMMDTVCYNVSTFVARVPSGCRYEVSDRQLPHQHTSLGRDCRDWCGWNRTAVAALRLVSSRSAHSTFAGGAFFLNEPTAARRSCVRSRRSRPFSCLNCRTATSVSPAGAFPSSQSPGLPYHTSLLVHAMHHDEMTKKMKIEDDEEDDEIRAGWWR